MGNTIKARVEIFNGRRVVWNCEVWYACITWPAHMCGVYPCQCSEMYTRSYRSSVLCRRAIKRFLKRNNMVERSK